MDPNVLVIAGDPRVQRVELAGTVYALRPMTVPQVEAFVRVGGAGLTGALSAAFAGESERPDMAALLLEHGPVLRRALAVATPIPAEHLDALDPAALIQLTDVVLGVNLDFFVQRVRPALGRLIGTVTRIASRASPQIWPTAAQH